MSKLISIIFLLISANSSLFAQKENLNIDSLRSANTEKRHLTESRKAKLDELVKKIESSGLSDEEISRMIHPLLKEYDVNSYEEFLLKYDRLLTEDLLKLDSIDLQIWKVDSLYQLVSIGVLEQRRIDSLNQENERLKSIMKNYLTEIESLKSNTTASIDSANLYYYPLNMFKKPNIYFYSCPQNAKRSQYWKISTNRKKNKLITEAFGNDLIQFERFEEELDSAGSNLVNYEIIGKDSITRTTVEKGVVYLWKSSQPYTYQVKYNTPGGTILFSKTRTYLKKDSILVLGDMKEVLVFKGEYEFFNQSSNESYSYYQYSYYAKEIGFVKYERIIPISDTDYEFINLELDSILTKKEWKKLTKRNVPIIN